MGNRAPQIIRPTTDVYASWERKAIQEREFCKEGVRWLIYRTFLEHRGPGYDVRVDEFSRIPCPHRFHECIDALIPEIRAQGYAVERVDDILVVRVPEEENVKALPPTEEEKQPQYEA